MSPWLKTRLLALCCGALIIGSATYLRAQERQGAPAKTAEDAAKNFRLLLDIVRTPTNVERYQLNNEKLLQLSGSIMRTQFEALGEYGIRRYQVNWTHGGTGNFALIR